MFILSSRIFYLLLTRDSEDGHEFSEWLVRKTNDETHQIVKRVLCALVFLCIATFECISIFNRRKVRQFSGQLN